MPNANQLDSNDDGIGDACESTAADRDGDGRDDVDNCPDVANPAQTDSDGDGQGGACDADVDGDGLEGDEDNCPDAVNPDQLDSDEDGLGDAYDPRNDGLPAVAVTGSSAFSACSQRPGERSPLAWWWWVLALIGLSRLRAQPVRR